jgi:hypothetical protein
METEDKEVASVNIYKVAGFAALAMILFFIVMKLLGFANVVELRFLNFIILFIAIRHVLLEARKENHGKLEYLSGMLTGFMTGFYASLLFSLFVVLYLYFDKNFMEYVKASQPFGSYLTPGSAGLVTVIEGVAGGAIFAFALMHILNRDRDQG